MGQVKKNYAKFDFFAKIWYNVLYAVKTVC